MALDQTGIRVADLAAVTSAAATDSFLVETAGGTKRIQKQHLIPDLAGVTALENRLQTNGAQFTLDYKDGEWGWNEKPTRGADTFHPFSKGLLTGDWKITIKLTANNSYSNKGSGGQSGKIIPVYTLVFRFNNGVSTLEKADVNQASSTVCVPDGSTSSARTEARYTIDVGQTTISIEPWS